YSIYVVLFHLSFCSLSSPFFFNDTPTTEIYTLSLHDALPIFDADHLDARPQVLHIGGDTGDQATAAHRHEDGVQLPLMLTQDQGDRKSTRLNSSHVKISYAVFCLKKKKKKNHTLETKEISKRR